MRQIFKAIVGSQSYGTSIPTSDIDYKGIYVQSHRDLLGFGYKEQFEIGKDESYYEVKRYLQLLSSANPTVLELLYSPEDCIICKGPEFELMKAVRSKFLTKKCRDSFGGYAVQQIKKAKGLDKKMNYEKERIIRKDIMDFCYVVENHFSTNAVPLKEYLKKNKKEQQYCGLVNIDHIRDCYFLYYDHIADQASTNPRFGEYQAFRGIMGEDSNEVRLSSVPEYRRPEAIVYFNKDGYSMHCKDFNAYQTWLENRSTQRFIDVKGHNQKIDGKNLLHCRRLLDTALEIAETGTIQVRRPNAAYLLQIRRGEVDLNSIIDKAEEDLIRLDEVYANCSLPTDVNGEFVNELLLSIRYL